MSLIVISYIVLFCLELPQWVKVLYALSIGFDIAKAYTKSRNK